ncbi:hypothetical protein ACMFAY_19965 [Klebsiella pneumoniae]|uniref:hypothetical protein n=1 Tax=Klebsiella pneumoniae TaxID=573 RepID=UPI0029735ADB|nr:hypothetical protein [Klebsiella pneumoniae]
MNIETVKELIAYLESAGELSIREQKFLKLAKAYQELAAENVGLKSYRDTLDEIKSSLVGGGHGHMAKADMQAQSAVLDVIFDAFDDIETPATDRIVAGIKADGVEDMANHFFKLAKDEANSLIAEQWRESGRVANEQAKQLREGADK